MKNKIDYSIYKCPYSYIEKDYKHELNGPEGYDTESIWCPCGYRAPTSIIDPAILKLELINKSFYLPCKHENYHRVTNNIVQCNDCDKIIVYISKTLSWTTV